MRCRTPETGGNGLSALFAATQTETGNTGRAAEYQELKTGPAFGLGIAYYCGLGAAALLFIYQQRLIRERVPAACFRAFLHNNWVGLVIFAGIVADYLLRAVQG